MSTFRKFRCFFQALGNHEFDNGVDGLMKPFMQKIQCPVLSANIKPDKTLAPTFGTSYLPYKILTVGDQKVGVVGYTSRETSDLSRPGTWSVFPSVICLLTVSVVYILS